MIHAGICCQLIWRCECVSEGYMSARAYSRTRKQMVDRAHGVASLRMFCWAGMSSSVTVNMPVLEPADLDTLLATVLCPAWSWPACKFAVSICI